MKVYSSFIIDPYFAKNDFEKFKKRVSRLISRDTNKDLSAIKFTTVGKSRNILDTIYNLDNLSYKDDHYVILDTNDVINRKIRYKLVRSFCLDKDSYKYNKTYSKRTYNK